MMVIARSLVLSSALSFLCALVACGGSSQFQAKSPRAGTFGQLKSALESGASKKGCKSEDRGDNFAVTCFEPDYRQVRLSKLSSSEELSWTCTIGESACRAFVDELLAAGQ